VSELYAICRIGNIPLVKRVLLNNGIKQQVTNIFLAQESSFLSGINAEISFDGSWKPDPDEILVAANVPDVQIFQTAIAHNPVSLPAIDANNFESENIRALAVVVGTRNNRRALLQSFGPQLVLSRKISFVLQGGVFNRLTEPGFSLDDGLVGMVTHAGALKFKSYFLIRRVFDLAHTYREATHVELVSFCDHDSISIADPTFFIDDADEGIRKLVHAVIETGVLDDNTVGVIRRRASSIGFAIQVRSGQIVFPNDRKSKKALLSFLLNKVYQGPLSQQLLITNSNRPLTS
jgi:hypothetical protein